MSSNSKKLPYFNDLFYERPDINAFSENASRTRNHFQKWNKEKNLRDASLSFQKKVDDFNQRAYIAYLRSITSKNQQEKQFYQKEWDFLSGLVGTVENIEMAVNDWLVQKTSVSDLSDFFGSYNYNLIKASSIIRRFEDQDKLEGLNSQLADFFQKYESAHFKSIFFVHRFPNIFSYSVQARNNVLLSAKYKNYADLYYSVAFPVNHESWRVIRREFLSLGLQLLPYLWNTQSAESGQTSSEKTLVQATADMATLVSPNIDDFSICLKLVSRRVDQDSGWIEELFEKGYFNLNQNLGVEILQDYLPVAGVPFIVGSPNKSPYNITTLLEMIGNAYSLHYAEKHENFTPFIRPSIYTSVFSSIAYASLAMKEMSVFYGTHSKDFEQWLLRFFFIRTLYLAYMDEISDCLYGSTSKDLLMSVKLNSSQMNFFENADNYTFLFSNDFDFLKYCNFLEKPFITSPMLLGSLAGLMFLLNPDIDSFKKFCIRGEKEDFLSKLINCSLKNPMDSDNIKKLIYLMTYRMGY